MFPTCFTIIILHLVILLTKTDSEEVILSPSGDVLVCPGEDPGPLIFMCTTNWSFIEWNVTLVLESGARVVTSGIQVSAPLVVNGISFNNTVQGSVLGSRLLTSTLTAPEPITDLNGTEVSCTAIELSLDDAVTVSTTIHVTNGDGWNPSEVTMIQSSEVFGIENVTVTLELANSQESNVILYSVTTDPPAQTTLIGGGTMAQLVLQYNTLYRVTIVASHRCSRNETMIELHFINCGSLLGLLNDDIIEVIGSNQPAITGSSATLTCPSTHILNGSNTTVCMRNGKWEPDPTLVECIGNCGPLPSASGYVFPYTSMLEGSRVMFKCQDDPQSELTAVCTGAGKREPSPINVCDTSIVAIWIPSAAAARRSRDVVIISVASSISSFILGSLLFLSVGLACGCHWGRRWRKIRSEDGSTENQQTSEHTASPNPLYEDVFTQEQEPLELKENAACGSRSINTSRNNTVLA